MKPFFLTLILTLALAINISWAQTIRYVDNKAGAPTGALVYTTLQAAIDAAVANDIIHVAPSATTYGVVAIAKPLQIYGIGFNPDKDIPVRSTVTTINLNNGSSGTRISGLVVTADIHLAFQSNVTYTLSNISIENCDVQEIQVANACCNTGRNVDNVIIRNNIIGNIVTSGTSSIRIDMSGNYGTATNVIITNNVVSGYTAASGSLEGNGLLIKNNMFFGGGATQNSFTNLTNSTVSNNIFLGRAPTHNSTNLFGNTFSNNLSFSTNNNALPPTGTGVGNTGTGNLVNVDPLMTSVTMGNVFLSSFNLTPAGGSPLINAGTDGTNIGPTGGSIPFDPTGVPLPLIQQLNTTEVVKQGDNLNVTVKARGN